MPLQKLLLKNIPVCKDLNFCRLYFFPLPYISLKSYEAIDDVCEFTDICTGLYRIFNSVALDKD